ncbi:MAG: S24/S26 family peptidase [Rikenellaceae bacterium]
MSRKVIVQNNLLLDSVAAMVASGERVVLLTKGQSMLPFIVGGRDSVELCRVDGEICVGDIALAKIGSQRPRYIIHRVIKIEGDVVTLMGDGNLKGREQSLKSNIVARVTAIIKPHKTINPNSKREQRCAKIWQSLLPIRGYLLAILRRTRYYSNLL